MGLHFQQSYWNGIAYFRDFGARIFWQVGTLGIKKYRTICSTKMRVKYVFYDYSF